MKNTNYTNKYLLAIGAILLLGAFAIAKPISAFAQDDDGGSGYTDEDGGSGYTDEDGGSGYTDEDGGSGYTDEDGGSGYTDEDGGSGYTDEDGGSGYDETGSTGPVYTDSGSTYVDGGVYYGGGTLGSGPVYAYPVNSTVSTGGFSGGTLGGGPVYSTPINETVTTGGFSGGYQYGSPYPITSSYGGLDGSCSASFINAQTGTMVTWTGSATGGSGVYSYYWTGTNGLLGSGQYISQTYPDTGVESAVLTITSGDGQSITRTCSATLGNQVLAYTATNPNLQSVYLSNIPATGAGSVARVLGFISALLLWSMGLAYVFLKRNQNLENPITASVAATDANAEQSENFRMEINSDQEAITSIETYARMNKVLLSSDAVYQLAKQARLNKINPKEAIQKMSGSDWTTVGENDLEKYL